MTEVDGTPAKWTKIYWPLAMAFAVVFFIAAPAHLKLPALISGAVALGVPELYCALKRRWVDTFSVWVWDRLGETRSTPPWQWNAAHFLAFGCYCVIAADVDKYTFGLGTIQFGLSMVMTVWLIFHFFGFWWR